MQRLLKKEDRPSFDELEQDLIDQNVVNCTMPPAQFFEYANMAVFSLIIASLLLGLAKNCHYQFSRKPINKLTLRPLLWALLNLCIAAPR